MENEKHKHNENLPDNKCLSIYQNLCVESTLGNYINNYKSLTCSDIYTECKYRTIWMFNWNIYILLKADNKWTCLLQTKELCFLHDLGKLGNRFYQECIDYYFTDNGYC